MSKELEALENIKSLFMGSPIDLSQQFSIIEKALKNDDEEKFDLIHQVRELKDEIASLESFNSKLWVERKDNERKLKALEIIKEKRVNVRAFLKCCHREDGLTIYNNQCDNKSVMESKELTKEEYDSLKEVLL